MLESLVGSPWRRTCYEPANTSFDPAPQERGPLGRKHFHPAWGAEQLSVLHQSSRRENFSLGESAAAGGRADFFPCGAETGLRSAGDFSRPRFTFRPA